MIELEHLADCTIVYIYDYKFCDDGEVLFNSYKLEKDTHVQITEGDDYVKYDIEEWFLEELMSNERKIEKLYNDIMEGK